MRKGIFYAALMSCLASGAHAQDEQQAEATAFQAFLSEIRKTLGIGGGKVTGCVECDSHGTVHKRELRIALIAGTARNPNQSRDWPQKCRKM